MKIGILTYHWVYNMGANLQCLSTYKALEKLGVEPIVIDYVPKDNEIFQKAITASNQIRVHEEFNSLFKKTALCRSSEDISKEIATNKIDGVIIGSDAVFNIRKPHFSRSKFKMIPPLSDNRFPTPFLGTFNSFLPSPIPIVSLSVSCQNTNPKSFKSQKKDIAEALKFFSKITVRDNQTNSFVQYFTDGKVDPPITPDPVFYFDKSVSPFYTRDQILSKYKLPDNYILICLSRDGVVTFKQQWILNLKSSLTDAGYTPVQLDKTFGGIDIETTISIKRPIPPLDWYYLIKYSKGYIGVLMHPIVVCLHTNVPFFSFDNYGVPNIFGLHDMKTSKTYHIVNSAGQLDNYFHTSPFKKLPSPKSIVSALQNYNFEKGALFSQRQADKFEETITNLLSTLRNKYK